ncbi:uncharacterized protein A4U43_C07F30890 [Asparagus officinalis]|uniref:Uncharacterized protein n=1 Tax=Asparagus officinalis TaxID=4686 RepID=A0A5P1EGI2_ASPOF|nr:uncharacterized protein A4U43_C07F30890 [Asparagus officinalis]
MAVGATIAVGSVISLPWALRMERFTVSEQQGTLIRTFMAFLIPKKPSTSSYEDENSIAQSNITSCLYLKPKESDEATNGKSFEKEVVLRRIRHKKRVNRIQGAFQSFHVTAEREREADGWLEDAFSCP